MITPEQLIRPQSQEAGSTLDRPLEHLTACHRRIEQRLDTLERAADHLTDKRGEALEAMEACFRFFESNGILHTADEEESVFPRLQRGLSDAERAFITQLEDQHREADRLYGGLKSIAAQLEDGKTVSGELQQRFRTAAGQLAELYRSHIATEDRTLIALGQRILSLAELTEISREMKRRRGLTA
jgi:hemerythrin-like domain-containing protein